MKRQRKSLTKVVELQCAQWEESKLVINNFISMLYLNRNTCRSWGNMPCEGFVMPSKSIIISTHCVVQLTMSLFHQNTGSFWISLFIHSVLLKTITSNKSNFEISDVPPFYKWTHRNYYFNPENFKTYIKKWHKNTRSPQK